MPNSVSPSTPITLSSCGSWEAGSGSLVGEGTRPSRGRSLPASEVEIDNQVPWLYYLRQSDEARDAPPRVAMRDPGRISVKLVGNLMGGHLRWIW